MKTMKLPLIVLLFSLAFCGSSSEVLALGGINISPYGWNFGNVAIGDSVTQIFRVEHVSAEYPSEIWVYYEEILDDPIDSEPLGQDDLSSFIFTWAAWHETWRDTYATINGPLSLFPGVVSETYSWMEFEISFTPSYSGLHDTLLMFDTNVSIVPPGTIFYLNLSGNGFTAVPEPSTFILLGAGLAGLAAMGIRRRKS